MRPQLHIEITGPQTINGKRASFQSLWFLTRLYYARRFESVAGVVRLVDLRQQFTDTRSLRMFISRAFKDFAIWNLQVGWGEDVEADPRFLNQDRRSQGPFWLAAGESDKIACTVAGAPATQAELSGFLGLKSKPDRQATLHRLPLQADYWVELAGAQQQLRQGQLLSMLESRNNAELHAELQAGALAGFKRASTLAGNGLQRALSALGQAQVWRRLDDLDAARNTLRQLRRVLKEGHADEGGYLDAMEQILTAWCAYSERDFMLTEAVLAAMRQAEPRATVVRCHPRIRFEWHNLMALLKRDGALELDNFSAQQDASQASLGHFGTALDAAFELGSFDAAQQVTANIGMATWLFACEGLVGGKDLPAVRSESLRWLLLSDALCDSAGMVGQSPWNAIFLMRIARGDYAHVLRPTLAEFRKQRPMLPEEALTQFARSPAFRDKPPLEKTWRAMAERLMEKQRRGERRYTLLQRCGLWFEHAWYAAHDGSLDTAAQSLAYLDAELPALPVRDKAFFSQARACLPVELEER